MLERKLYRVALIALCLLVVGAGTAMAQVVYQVTSTPTFVISTGRAEVLGSVRLTAQNGPITSVGSTLQVQFSSTPCDNDATNGVIISVFTTAAGPNFTTALTAPAPNTLAISSVSNSSGSCVVSITVPGGLNVNTGDYIELKNARGRIDLSPASVPGTDVNAVLNATPSGSSLFTTPSTARVATSAVGLSVSIRTGVVLFCTQVLSPTARIRITEGFNGAFVQHVTSVAGTLPPADARPPAGATNNTRIQIVVTNLPAGFVITWPSTVAGTNIATSTVSAGTLQLISGDNTGAYYEFVTTSQGTSDINTERFDIILSTPANLTFPSTLALGSANVQAHLNPPLFTGDATSVTTGPFGATAPSGVTYPTVQQNCLNQASSAGVGCPAGGTAAYKPRFNDPLVPSPAGVLLSINPCATDLLFPYTANVAGFDTGLAIANTSKDPFGSVGALNQTGTCTLNGFPIGAGTPISFTTPTIAAGDTFLTVLSSAANTAFNGFQGYIIARCNFQFAHGFAFIQDGFGSTPRVAEGYVALVIPDPFVINSVLGTSTVTVGRQATTCTGNLALALGCIPNLGEGLTQ